MTLQEMTTQDLVTELMRRTQHKSNYGVREYTARHPYSVSYVPIDKDHSAVLIIPDECCIPVSIKVL